MFEEGWLAKNPHAGLILYSTLGAALVAVILLTNWPTYHFLVRGGPIPLWYYVLPGVLILPIIFAEPGYAIRPFNEPLFWWFVVYVVSGGVWLLLAQDFIEHAAAQWRLRILGLCFFYTITILTSTINRPFLALVIVGCVLIACAGNWFDVLRPYRFVPQGIEGAHSGRGAGFFMNPNVAGSFIAMATIVALPFIPMRFRAVVILCAVVGIVPTFSRSGFLYAGLLLFGAMLLKLVNRTQALLIIVVVPLLVGATAVSYDYLMASSDDANLHLVVRRLEWFQGVDETDEAAEGRLYGARQAWQMFLQEPVTGRGLGITTLEAVVQEGPHNMYLMLMAEQGFVGLALYLTLIAIVARHGRRLAKTAVDQEARDIGNATLLYAGFLAAYGFFSHNLLEEAQSIFVMAFITAAAMHAPRVATWIRAPTGDFPHRERIAGARPRLGQP